MKFSLSLFTLTVLGLNQAEAFSTASFSRSAISKSVKIKTPSSSSAAAILNQKTCAPLIQPISLASAATANGESKIDTTETTEAEKPKKVYIPADGKNRLIFTLAFMTGVADVAMVLKYSNFATMMTGNTMHAARHVSQGNLGLFVYLLGVISSYFIGLASFRTIFLQQKDKSLKYLAPIVTLAFLAADQLSFMNPLRKWPAMFLLSASFAILNAIGTDMTGTMCFVVTGHMTKIANALHDRFSKLTSFKKIDLPSFNRSIFVTFSFFLGAFAAWASNAAFPALKERGLLSIMGLVYGTVLTWQHCRQE